MEGLSDFPLSSANTALTKMFKVKENTREKSFLDDVVRPLPTFGYMGRLMRDHMEGRMSYTAWQDIISWYFEDKNWQVKLLNLPEYLLYNHQQHYLNQDTAKLLYPADLKTSISKLEAFRSCACNYFMRYGIRAEERKVFSLDHAQIGTLFHGALEQYPKELEVLGITWKDVNEKQMLGAVKNAVHFALTENDRTYTEQGKSKYISSQLEKMTRRAVSALTAHAKNSEFVPINYEVSFAEGKMLPPIHVPLDEERKIIITGQIDRVDVYYKDLAHSYVKILDYKTGQKHFNLLEVYYGLQLQLLLYLDAYLKLNEDYEPGGVFYFHITNPYITYRGGMSEEEIEKAHLKQFKLSGLALEELEVIQALDKENTGYAIPVSFNKDGSLKKGSSVANKEQFKRLEEHIVTTIKDLGQQILAGKVSSKPFKIGDKHPCIYCQYQTICQFDENTPDYTYEKLEHLSTDEIWEKLWGRKENE